jgi:hypothetical protein
MDTLYAIAGRRPDQRAHVAHIAGTQGLIWTRQSTMGDIEKQLFLERLLQQVRAALPDDQDEMLATLENNIRRELLLLAVSKDRHSERSEASSQDP